MLGVCYLNMFVRNIKVEDSIWVLGILNNKYLLL